MAAEGERIDWDTAFVCLAWAGLALIAWHGAGLGAGLAALFGPLPLMMLVTWQFLIRRGSVRETRIAHWVVLGAVTLVLLFWLAA